MQLISEKYTELNKKLHADRPGYGTGGARWADQVRTLANQFETHDILDYGCGKGLLSQELGLPSVKNYDPAVAAWSENPKPCDILVCTDVLEHIEPEFLRDVLEHIHSLTRLVAFLNISTKRANKFLADGRNAHLIVKDSRWWDAALGEFFEIEVVSVSKTEYNVLVVPKELYTISY